MPRRQEATSSGTAAARSSRLSAPASIRASSNRSSVSRPERPHLLAHRGTAAVQEGALEGDTISFTGTVDLAPERSVTPGAVGDDAYSPLVSTTARSC